MKIEKINELFARFAGQLLKMRWITLGIFALVIIVSVIGMKRMVKETSYADKVTSLTDIEFMVGSDEGMTIEQIVPDEIPAEGSAAMDSIKARAYSKPHVARKLISQKGDLSWIMVKLRQFPKDSVWKKQGTVSPDIITGQEVEHIIKKPEYASLHPKGTGMPYVTNGGVFNRLSADYALNDQLHTIVGYDFFHADSGMFAIYKKNSELWVKLKYSF